MWRFIVLAALATLLSSLLLLASCSDEGGRASATASLPPSGRLVVTGSSTMAPLINKIGKRFESLHPLLFAWMFKLEARRVESPMSELGLPI